MLIKIKIPKMTRNKINIMLTMILIGTIICVIPNGVQTFCYEPIGKKEANHDENMCCIGDRKLINFTL